ncbi:MAG: hypothetical protein Q4P66_06915 [Actinomycetaceae bacterium]|nr:hypothetical protein [Actinomycetaceae bacterium]
MKTLIKASVFIAVAGAVVWSIPPARTYVKNKSAEFSAAFREAEQRIVTQLMTDVPVMNQTVELDEDMF